MITVWPLVVEFSINHIFPDVVVVVLLFYVHHKHPRSCPDCQLT